MTAAAQSIGPERTADLRRMHGQCFGGRIAFCPTPSEGQVPLRPRREVERHPQRLVEASVEGPPRVQVHPTATCQAREGAKAYHGLVGPGAMRSVLPHLVSPLRNVLGAQIWISPLIPHNRGGNDD